MDLFSRDLSALELHYPDTFEELQDELDRSQSNSNRRRKNKNAQRKKRNGKPRVQPKRFYVGLLVRGQNGIELSTIELEDRYSRADMVSKRYLTKYFRGDDDQPWMDLIEPEPVSYMTSVWDTQELLLTVFTATAQRSEPNEFCPNEHGRLIHRYLLKRRHVDSLRTYQNYNYTVALRDLI